MMISTLMLALLGGSSAHAFCGTYVGGAGAELYNSVSEVALVRQDGRTTLSLSNDVQGNFDDFALVIPVPEVMPEDAIHTLDQGLFDRLDAYSAPRLVSYVCEDFEPQDEDDWAASEDGGGGGADTGGVDVEAEYVVGEYRIVILSSTESDSLLTWLNSNGYAVPDTSADLLQEYIDAGSYFFAAQVDESANIADGQMLSPLQFSYAADVFSLPIRIGTLNSKDIQDLIIYGVNTYEDGKLAISNYPEVSVEDECLWKADGEEFGAFYADQYWDAYQSEAGAVWVTEYAWGGSGCDPCTGDPPDEADLITLNYHQPEDWRTVYDVYFTRIHMRYSPSEAIQDVSLYNTRMQPTEQVRYIEYESYLEDRFPVCAQGWATNPGSCDSPSDWGWGQAGQESDPAPTAGSSEISGSGCDVVSGAALGAWAISGLMVLARRRRED